MTTYPGSDRSAPTSGFSISARLIGIALLRRARRILLFAAAAGIVALIVLLLIPRTHTSSASFTPQARRTPSGNLSGIAAQFGLVMPTGDAAQSPQFYADLLQSAEILGPLVETRFQAAPRSRPDSATLVELLEVSGDTPALKREAAIKQVQKNLLVTLNPKTGLVRVQMRASSPTLARDVVERLLNLLDAFNQEHRQSQATAERRFTERRLSAVRAEARLAEDSLQVFLQQNRTYENSPSLRFMYDRLSRAVTLHQQVLSTLSQAFEQARLEEVRDTPVLTIVERPSVPARPDSRGVPIKVVAAMMLVVVLGALFAIVSELSHRGFLEDSAEGEELSLLWADFTHGLSRPFDRFSSAAARRAGGSPSSSQESPATSGAPSSRSPIGRS